MILFTYLSFPPAASVEVIDLYGDVILFSRQPLDSDALVRGKGDRAQNVITAEKATESDKGLK